MYHPNQIAVTTAALATHAALDVGSVHTLGAGITGMVKATAGVPAVATQNTDYHPALIPTVIKTANYTCAASFEDVRINPTAAGFWVKPIAVPADGDLWRITNEYPSVNAIVVTANTATVAQTIEGLASITIARAYFCITLKYNLALLSWTVESIN